MHTHTHIHTLLAPCQDGTEKLLFPVSNRCIRRGMLPSFAVKWKWHPICVKWELGWEWVWCSSTDRMTAGTQGERKSWSARIMKHRERKKRERLFAGLSWGQGDSTTQRTGHVWQGTAQVVMVIFECDQIASITLLYLWVWWLWVVELRSCFFFPINPAAMRCLHLTTLKRLKYCQLLPQTSIMIIRRMKMNSYMS